MTLLSEAPEAHGSVAPGESHLLYEKGVPAVHPVLMRTLPQLVSMGLGQTPEHLKDFVWGEGVAGDD